MELQSATRASIASINGVALNREDETLSAEELRQRACAGCGEQRAHQRDIVKIALAPALAAIQFRINIATRALHIQANAAGVLLDGAHARARHIA